MVKKIRYFIISMILLILGLLFLFTKNYQETIGGKILSEVEIQKIQQKYEQNQELEVKILYNDYEIPYDVDRELFYFPLENHRLVNKLKFQLMNSEQKIYWSDDIFWKDLDEAIENSHKFIFYVIDGNQYKSGELVFTGLPMMNLNRVAEGSNSINYKMDLFDPFSDQSNVYRITNSYAYCEVRGHTSLGFPKLNYNLNLYTQKEKPNDQSLLGLRSDDDWKLNAFYSDGSRVREAVAVTLWNEIAETTPEPYDSGANFQYMELMIDGHYQGIYGLLEQIDFKQLNIDKNKDILYKGTYFISDENKSLQDLGNRIEFCGQIIKSGNRMLSEELWNPMIEYVTMMEFFDGSQMEGKESEIWNYITKHMNSENLFNFDLYVQAIHGIDNAYKNQYIAAVMDGKGQYMLWKSPWDLNYCFGDKYDSENDLLTSYNLDDHTKIMNKYMLSTYLLNSKYSQAKDVIKNQWNMLRKNILTTAHVEELAEKFSEKLEDSGAVLRETDQWSESIKEDSKTELVAYFEQRVEFLDSYYNSF